MKQKETDIQNGEKDRSAHLLLSETAEESLYSLLMEQSQHYP